MTASSECAVPESELREGCVGKDCIPSLDDPELVDPAEVTYLRDSSRVVGLEIDGRAVAIAHNVLRWHEVVNLTVDTAALAVTYCPLTGSSLAFDRGAIDGRDLGVSGLLHRNNLVMYDRTDRTSEESLWTQMRASGTCGPRAGTRLPVVDAVDVRWEGWRQMHPNTVVVSDDGGTNGRYRRNEYGAYERTDNDRILFPLPEGIDPRRPPKERILGIPDGEEFGVAFPYGTLEEASSGEMGVVEASLNGRDLVILWNGAHRGAEAFYPEVDGRRVHLVVRDGSIVDEETESTWNLVGRAVDGPLAGAHLEPVPEAYTAFWFAWASFQPRARLWNPE